MDISKFSNFLQTLALYFNNFHCTISCGCSKCRLIIEVEVINIAGYRNAGNESRFTILTQWAMPKRNHIFLVIPASCKEIFRIRIAEGVARFPANFSHFLGNEFSTNSFSHNSVSLVVWRSAKFSTANQKSNSNLTSAVPM